VVVYDHGSGEAADFIGVWDNDDEVLVRFYHCKKTKEHAPGCRLEDLYEVVGQAVKTNRWLHRSDLLLDHLKRRAAGKPYRFPVGRLADLGRLLRSPGKPVRYEVAVVPKTIELPNSRVDLVFEITEGGKTGIKSIDFVGNKAYSGYRLKEVIKTTETGILAFLQTGNTYDADRVEADRELLRRWYLKHGYIDVRVVAARGEFDPARRGFVVVFQIEEGEQYRVGTVNVQSNVRTLNADVLRPKVRLSSYTILM
jgi:outer membrane protein insertion porin family